MTAILKENGSIEIPKEARVEHKLDTGTEFTITTRSTGEIILRPVKKRRRHRTLAANLRALSGLDLIPEKGTAREIEL